VIAARDVLVELPDEAATGRLAARLAGRARLGDVIGLEGPLGSGKTSFARAFIRAYGGAEPEVPSPTFTLVEIYAFAGKPPVWHFDLYRIERPEDAYELGIEEAWSEGVSLVEWPERLGSLLPPGHLRLALAEGGDPGARIARLAASPAWAGRLDGLADG
jgi:tRNA threonylcarbamoyl adenosine modification protein YjeE